MDDNESDHLGRSEGPRDRIAPRGIAVEFALVPTEASNDREFVRRAAELGAGELLDRLMRAADSPKDRPDPQDVVLVAPRAIAALADRLPGAAELAARISSAAAEMPIACTAGATSDAASRRKSHHLVYWLIREVAACIRRLEQLDEVALMCLGAWIVRGLVSSWTPRPRPIARAHAALVRPTSHSSKAWSARARERTLDLALTGVLKAIGANSAAATALGLIKAVGPEPGPVDDSPWARFNRLFRRRVNNLRTLAPQRAAAGVLGHGTLSAGGLRGAGGELLEGTIASDCLSALVYFEIVTHLPCETVGELPVVVTPGAAAPAALAWIDLAQGTYHYTLFRLQERGAKPQANWAHAVEVSEQVVIMGLSEPALILLRENVPGDAPSVVILSTLLKGASHHPRSSVLRGRGYKVTARRLQESVPAVLLAAGHSRWPVLLATCSPFLVSAGRDSYGLCRSEQIDECVDAAHDAIGWPRPAARTGPAMLGSRVTPRAVAVTALLNHLAGYADRNWAGTDTPSAAIRTLRAVAPWMSCLAGLTLALRMRVRYRVPGRQVESGDRVRFNDKYLDGSGAVTVPVCPTLALSYQGWRAIASAAARTLCMSDEPAEKRLGHWLRETLADPQARVLVVTVDAALRPVVAGWRTWASATPTSLMLPGNYGRHFLPMPLMDRGVKQRVLDVLTRHQGGGSDPRSASGTSLNKLDFESLRRALEALVRELGLRFPACWPAQPGNLGAQP